jgi:hypothetical protein
MAAPLRPVEEAYDTRVAGVLSGAGRFRPALVLDRRTTGRRRAPVAVMGKVHCLVDADQAPIHTGDLLTSSATRGHAMRVTDRSQALGAVIGKALAPLPKGRAIIPVLITLQ